MKRQKLNLEWINPDLQDLRTVAEEIWQLAYNDELSLADLHGRSAYCDLKIYRVVEEMLRTGMFALQTESNQMELVENR